VDEETRITERLRREKGRSAPEILDRPIRAGSRHRGLSDLEIVADRRIADQFFARWNALTIHCGVDPNNPNVWKQLVAAVAGFDFDGFEAPEAGWQRLARKLIHEHFPGFNIYHPPVKRQRKWTPQARRDLFQLVENKRLFKRDGTIRTKPQSISSAVEQLWKERKNIPMLSTLKCSNTLKREYDRAKADAELIARSAVPTPAMIALLFQRMAEPSWVPPWSVRLCSP
jgi:hypothetical protein